MKYLTFLTGGLIFKVNYEEYQYLLYFTNHNKLIENAYKYQNLKYIV